MKMSESVLWTLIAVSSNVAMWVVHYWDSKKTKKEISKEILFTYSLILFIALPLGYFLFYTLKYPLWLSATILWTLGFFYGMFGNFGSDRKVNHD